MVQMNFNSYRRDIREREKFFSKLLFLNKFKFHANVFWNFRTILVIFRNHCLQLQNT